MRQVIYKDVLSMFELLQEMSQAPVLRSRAPRSPLPLYMAYAIQSDAIRDTMLLGGRSSIHFLDFRVIRSLMLLIMLCAVHEMGFEEK